MQSASVTIAIGAPRYLRGKRPGKVKYRSKVVGYVRQVRRNMARPNKGIGASRTCANCALSEVVMTVTTEVIPCGLGERMSWYKLYSQRPDT